MRKQARPARKPAGENDSGRQLAQLRREVDELRQRVNDADRTKRAANATRSQADHAIKAMARLLTNADLEIRHLRGVDLDDDIPF